jgi:hypothetical protein
MKSHRYLEIIVVFVLLVSCQPPSSDLPTSTPDEDSILYELTTNIDPPGAGVIAPSSGYFLPGDEKNLRAQANSGYTFDHWSGDVSGKSQEEKIIFDGNKTVTAHFIRISVLKKFQLDEQSYSSSHSGNILMDFDSDGDLDLILNQFDWPPPQDPQAVLAYRNDGDGNFTKATREVFADIPLVTTTARHWAIEDFNGDGRDDLFIADHGQDHDPAPGGQSLILIQNEDGQLIDETQARLPQQMAFTHNVAAGDIDQDGDVDIYMCNVWGATQIGPRFYINDGNGFFSEDTARIPGEMTRLERKFTASLLLDVDQDGDLDLVLGGHDNAGARDVILLNDGEGTFSYAPDENMPLRLGGPDFETVQIVSDDFNKDGWPDLLMSTHLGYQFDANMQLLMNNGNGTFREETFRIEQDWSFYRNPEGCGSETDGWLTGLYIVDANNDTWPDILVQGDSCLQHLLFLSDKGERFVISENYSQFTIHDGMPPWALMPGDIDNDGNLDVVLLYTSMTQQVYLRIPSSENQVISSPTPTQATPSIETPVLVSRYMLPSVPNFPMEILGAKCNYQGDIWGEKAAYIAYDCPDLNITWLSARFTNLEEGEVAMDLFGQVPSEVNMGVVNSRIGPKDLFGQLPSEGATSITPADLLSEFDNITILGRVENSEYAYFMMYETESYAVSSEVFFPEDTATLEEFYSDNVEKVFHAVLEIMLENIKHGGSSLQPTPMATNQQNLYNQIAPWLVTMSEANEFYQGASDMFGDSFDGIWVSLGDDVNAERESVCRIFEDRSNADAPLVAFYNCVYIRPDFDLNKLKENFPNSVELESAFEYSDQSIIYGHKLNNGHTSLNAFILQDEYLIYIFVESRTLMGYTPEDVFKGFNDDFIYDVLMTNLERYSEGFPPAPKPNPLIFRDDFDGAIKSEWTWIRADDNQWNLTEYPGFLHVNLTHTSNAFEEGPDTLLVQWIENENFEITTRVLFEPERNFQRVGMVIYENRENYIGLLRSYADIGNNPGNAIYFDHVSPSAPLYDDADYQNFPTQITNPSEVYLKLRREENTYTGYYSLDGQSWTTVGVHRSSIEPVSYGFLIGKSDQPISADFDYFELYSLP